MNLDKSSAPKSGGTKVYCPNCKGFAICKAVSPTTMGEPKGQRWYRTDHEDIAWFRRGRVCLVCEHNFLSAEVEEKFIAELVELRNRLAKKQKEVGGGLYSKAPWLKRNETIPKDVAVRFIQASTWWLTHSSGNPVRAPGHAKRIYLSHHGWAIDFGANTFLIGKAIARCRDTINQYVDEASKGSIPTIVEIKEKLMRQISGAVANSNGYEYDSYYPITYGELIFGAQAINVNDGASFLIRETGVAAIALYESF